MRPNSLAFKLLIYAVVWSAIALLGTGWVLSLLFRTAMERNFDARLQAYLHGLVGIVELDASGRLAQLGDIGDGRFALPESGWYWQISPPEDAGEMTPLSSRSLLDAPFPPVSGEVTSVGRDGIVHYYSKGPAGQNLRVVRQNIQLAGSDSLFAFIVGGNSAELEEEISNFTNTLRIAMTLVCIGVIVTALIQIRFGLQPLRDFQRSLARIRSGDEVRLTGQYPEELKPVAKELNELLQSNEEIVERARTHVGNLAHALKTPLSVITNEAQAEDTGFSAKVAEQADIMRGQIQHYLDRARMAARGRALGAVTNMAAVLDALERTLRRIHADRGIGIAIECPRDVRFRGEKQDLEELAGNLLDNACKWAGSRVAVSVSRIEGKDGDPLIELVIEDDGPGLSDDQKREAVVRGRRLDETTPGSGLGLSIVADLVALYSGSVSLDDSPEGGLRVTVRLPAV